MKNIFNNMEISGSTLLASAIFCESRWITKSMVAWRLAEIIHTVRLYRDYRLPAQHKSIESFIETYLGFFESQDFIVKSDKSGIMMYKIKSKKHGLMLKYYFNNISEILLPRSILCFLTRKHTDMDTDGKYSIFLRITGILRYDIQFSGQFCDEKCLSALDELISIPGDKKARENSLVFWSEISYHLRMGYYFSISIMELIFPKIGTVLQKNLVNNMVKLANIYHKTGIIENYGIISVSTFNNAVELMIDEQALCIAKNSDKPGDRILGTGVQFNEICMSIKDMLSMEYEREKDVLNIPDEFFFQEDSGSYDD
jgi:hypothetical protein